MSKAVLVQCREYRIDLIDKAVRRAVDLAGGMTSVVKPGDRVLIKPNMLSAKEPDRHVTTHPAVVGAVARLVLEAGGKPVIGDSPALDRFGKVADKTGIQGVGQALGLEVLELRSPTPSPPHPASIFKNLELASLVLKSDVVLNVGKVKTHSLMLLTLAVKNLFGTVVAQRKGEWHLAVGIDREAFASLLLDIYMAVRPAMNILDGVYGMEGRGPSNGQVRPLGFIGCSRDALALDLTVCRLLGVPLEHFPLYRAALKRGLISSDQAEIEFLGDSWSEFDVKNFKLPELEASPGGSGALGRFLARRLVSKPVHLAEACLLCGQCSRICPAGALSQSGRRLIFDYDRCIRCYCCQEICPQNAIGFRKGFQIGRASCRERV